MKYKFCIVNEATCNVIDGKIINSSKFDNVPIYYDHWVGEEYEIEAFNTSQATELMLLEHPEVDHFWILDEIGKPLEIHELIDGEWQIGTDVQISIGE